MVLLVDNDWDACSYFPGILEIVSVLCNGIVVVKPAKSDPVVNCYRAVRRDWWFWPTGWTNRWTYRATIGNNYLCA